MGLLCSRILVLLSLLLLPVVAECKLRYYKFDVVMQNFTKLCSTKSIVTVNGKFPGPTLYAREGDRIIVRVINHVQYNITIHWHGIRQLRSCWSDGPAYIAQCPIQPNQSYIYNFTITDQRGTLFWHAHISWLRATVHGPIIILPKRSVSYPFPKPYKQKTLVLSEWWKSDTETIINQAMQTGSPPNVSDAHTFNGHTGPTHNCSSSSLHDTLTLHVIHNKTYLLRIINTALNDEFFLKIANHNFTIVEVDASYIKPFTTDTIYIAPGQTTNALLTTNQPPGKYTIATHAFMDAPTVAVNNFTNYAILHYKTSSSTSIIPTTLPLINSTLTQSTFTDSLRSLNSITYPTTVPTTINHNLLFTVGVGVNPCPTCLNGSKLVGDINNVTFTLPSIAVLQAYYFNIPGVFTDDFPGRPLISFNYTGSTMPANLATMNGTRVYRVKYNETVQVVLQDTAMIAPESHPIHLHGYNFYVVGKGIGNFDPVNDSKKFNLIDPVERNTIDAPNGGWTAIRFRADNPGVWFMHCHLEVHTSWGLKMAFLVEDGDGPNHSLLPPPNDLPNC